MNFCDWGWFMLFLDPALAANLCQLGIELCSNEHGEACPVEPDHQCNRCAKRSIGLIEASEMPEINTKQIGKCNPTAHSQNRTRQRGRKPLLRVRREEVQSFHS